MAISGVPSKLVHRVETFVNEMLHVERLESAFNLFLVHNKSLEDSKSQQRLGEWLDVLRDCPDANHADAAVKSLVSCGGNVAVDAVMILLEGAVSRKVLDARKVCDALLSSDHMKHDSKTFWVQAFRLVHKIIDGVDYKGVREIMKNSIEKVTAFPRMQSYHNIIINPATRINHEEQLDAVHQVLAYIFDRNSALLPGYFIVNEILKSYPENPVWPHWRFVPMVSKLLNSFRAPAQMVSSSLRHKMRPVVELSGKNHLVSTWKMDPMTLKFSNRGTPYDRILPFAREICQPQKDLLLFILRQFGSKELVNSVLGVQKPQPGSALPATRLPMLEEQLIEFILEAINETDKDPRAAQILWWNLTSQIVFFLLYQFVSFNGVIDGLSKRIVRPFRGPGRDEITWVLFHYLSGIQKQPLKDFLSIFKLLSFYDEVEPLPVPDIKEENCERKLAAALTYSYLMRKSQDCSSTLKFSLPVALRQHLEYVRQLPTMEIDVARSIKEDFLVPLTLNSLPTQPNDQGVMQSLIATISGANLVNKIAMPGSANCFAHSSTEPLSIQVLDSMSVCTKISVIHAVVKYIANFVSSKSNLAIAPALAETYSRLLVYAEVESLGVKGVLNQLLPSVFKQGSWGTLNMLLEMFSYRLYHIQAQFRLQLLSTLQVGWISSSHTVINKHPQLNVSVESTIMRLITGLGNSEIMPPKSSTSSGQSQADKTSSNVLYGESEELNRVVILTLARAIHINGLEPQHTNWLKDVLTNIMRKTPHSWPQETLQNFPVIIQNFYKNTPGPSNKETEAQLNRMVDEEYKMWISMSNEQDIVQHFCTPTNTLFLCVIWRVLLEKDEIQPIAYKVLERIGAKQLNYHLRSFCDLVVNKFNTTGEAGYVCKCIKAITSMIWKYNIIPIDRLILCMILRTYEGNRFQVCFLLLHLFLLKPQDFRNRVSELVKTMSPEHHLMNDFHSKHVEFHNKFPEKFSPENDSLLPTYFGNVCLRLIPVFDVVIHRFLELPVVTNQLVTMINHIGVLYKFHDRPILYLYNTLHYYERRLRDRPVLKKALIANIVGALKDVRPEGWALSQRFQQYVESKEDGEGWKPGLDYYMEVVGRFARTMQGNKEFPYMDWRFNEFPNVGVHALYISCVEIMGLPGEDPTKVGSRILDVILEAHHAIGKDLADWANAVGLLFSSLPDSFAEGLTHKLVGTIASPPLSQWTLSQNIFQVLDLSEIEVLFQGPTTNTNRLVFLLCLAHCIWHHSGLSQIQQLPELVREKLEPLVRTEEQLLYVYHLVCPFLQRLHSERFNHPLFDLTRSLYRMLAKVDKQSQLKHMDEICDVLYHVKYQFTGDSVKDEAERLAKDFRPELQLRLKFIAPGIFQQKDQQDHPHAEGAEQPPTKKPRMMTDHTTATLDAKFK